MKKLQALRRSACDLPRARPLCSIRPHDIALTHGSECTSGFDSRCGFEGRPHKPPWRRRTQTDYTAGEGAQNPDYTTSGRTPELCRGFFSFFVDRVD